MHIRCVTTRDWGVTTEKGDKMYVHVLNLQDDGLYLPVTGKKVKKAILFKNKSAVKFSQDKEGVLLKFNEVPTDIDYVIELTLQK